MAGFDAIASGESATPKTETIIRDMLARYQGVISYQDSGVVRIVSVQPTIARVAGYSCRSTALEDGELVS